VPGSGAASGSPRFLIPLTFGPGALPWTSSPRTRGAFERVDEVPVQVAFEARTIDGDGEVGASLRQTFRRGEECSRKRHGITYRAADVGVELSRQSDVYQCRPRDTPGDSAALGLDASKVVVSDEVVGPFLWGPDRNRSYRNAIESHYKFPIYLGPMPRRNRFIIMPRK
jgi:hypothetical protein